MKFEEFLTFICLICNANTMREYYFALSDVDLLDYDNLQTSTVLYNVKNKIHCGIICSQLSTLSSTNRIMYHVYHPNITQSQCAVFNDNCLFVDKVTSCKTDRSDNLGTCTCIVPYVGSYCHLLSTCESVKNSTESLVNGIYRVVTSRGEIIEIFCDFQTTQIITFISKQSLSLLTSSELMQIGSNRTRVVLRQDWKNHQRDSILSQLSTYSTVPFSIYINEKGNFANPINKVLGNYFFLGFLDRSYVYNNSINGYATNFMDQSFLNCGNAGYSYFGFYSNLENKTLSVSNNASSRADMFAWANNGETIAANQELTPDYFYVTEVHFGGCGGLTTSDNWNTITGTSLGLITDII